MPISRPGARRAWLWEPRPSTSEAASTNPQHATAIGGKVWMPAPRASFSWSQLIENAEAYAPRWSRCLTTQTIVSLLSLLCIPGPSKIRRRVNESVLVVIQFGLHTPAVPILLLQVRTRLRPVAGMRLVRPATSRTQRRCARVSAEGLGTTAVRPAASSTTRSLPGRKPPTGPPSGIAPPSVRWNRRAGVRRGVSLRCPPRAL